MQKKTTEERMLDAINAALPMIRSIWDAFPYIIEDEDKETILELEQSLDEYYHENSK